MFPAYAFFELDNTLVSGTVPTQLGQLTSLQQLYAASTYTKRQCTGRSLVNLLPRAQVLCKQLALGCLADATGAAHTAHDGAN